MSKKHPKRDNLDNQTLKLEKEIKELKAGWQRTQADFENYKKRVEAEKLENFAYAKAEFMTKIAPVLDNFEYAFAHIKKDPSRIGRRAEADTPEIEGFLQIKKQLEDILVEEGLEKIPSQSGTRFDPALYEAISYEKNDLPADTIIETCESGWKFGERVIKPAKVRVSKGKS